MVTLSSAREAQRKCWVRPGEGCLLARGLAGLGVRPAAWRRDFGNCSLLCSSARPAGLPLSVYVSVSPIRPPALRGQGARFVQIPIPRVRHRLCAQKGHRREAIGSRPRGRGETYPCVSWGHLPRLDCPLL